MDCDLLTQQLVKGALYKGAANNLGCPLEQFVQLLDVVGSGNTKKLEHGLVVLESQDGLVTCCRQYPKPKV
jgi:hypothetical protein